MIRKAHISDRYQVLKMCELFWEESRYNLPIDIKLVGQLYDEIIKDENVLFLVSEKNEVLTGMLIGCLSRTLFSPKPIAMELAWFVKDEFRGKSDAVKLMKAYEVWAKSMNCHSVCMADLSSTNDLQGFYEKMGYTLVEKSYIKEL